MNIAVFAGPSGGHLFPALAFAQAFRRRYPESRLWLVTGKKAGPMVASWPADGFQRVFFLNDFPFPRRISFRALLFLLQLPQAFFLSAIYLKKSRPDLCVGFGSYASFPGIFLASCLKIPVLVHEQNVIPGKATEWLAARADCVAVSFPQTFAGKRLKRLEWTGLPVRMRLVESAQKTAVGRPGDPSRILIVGGSQGAHRINEIVLDAFARFANEEKAKIAVIHITGKADYEWVCAAYKRLNVSHQAYPFFDNIDELYRQADFALTRAGANTLFELALFRLPAAVVPYPFAEAHQAANAGYFAGRGALMMRHEAGLTGDWFAETLRAVMRKTDDLKAMPAALARLAVPDAADRLVNIAESLIGRSI